MLIDAATNVLLLVIVGFGLRAVLADVPSHSAFSERDRSDRDTTARDMRESNF